MKWNEIIIFESAHDLVAVARTFELLEDMVADRNTYTCLLSIEHSSAIPCHYPRRIDVMTKYHKKRNSLSECFGF